MNSDTERRCRVPHHLPYSRLPKNVYVRGRRFQIRKQLEVGGRVYGLIECLSDVRDRHLAFDPSAGPDGDLRALHFYPHSQETAERLRVLKRLSEEDTRFPTIISYHINRDEIAVVLQWRWGIGLQKYVDDLKSRQSPRPSLPTVVRMLRNLAHAVGKLNNRMNIIHGDIKPGNIVMPPDSTNLSLIDFGSAWCIEQTVTQAGKGDGVTPDGYAAPEQRSPGPPFPDFRSDLFSIGVVTYELLTLKIPYEGLGGGAGADAELYRSYATSYVPPSKLRIAGDATPSFLWQRMDRILERSLRLRQEDRYPNRDEWLQDIDDLFALIIQKPALSAPAKLVVGIAELASETWRSLFGRDNR